MRTRYRASVSIVALAFAALLVSTLSGCAAEERATLPSLWSSPKVTSTSPSPSVVGGRAGVPDDAKEHTRAGAEAFARYYLELVNIAWTKPDASVFNDLGEPDCVYCQDMIKYAKNLGQEGRRYDSTVMDVHNFSKSDVIPKAGQEWFVANVDQHAANVVDAKGSTVEVQEPMKVKRVVLVQWRQGAWYFGDTGLVTE